MTGRFPPLVTLLLAVWATTPAEAAQHTLPVVLHAETKSGVAVLIGRFISCTDHSPFEGTAFVQHGKVTMQRVSWADAQQQFLREAAVGTAPDVAQLAQVWPRAFGNAGALRPLDDLIAQTGIGVAGWDQFVARDMQQGADGKTYAIPFTVDTFAMVYNKDLLRAPATMNS